MPLPLQMLEYVLLFSQLLSVSFVFDCLDVVTANTLNRAYFELQSSLQAC